MALLEVAMVALDPRRIVLAHIHHGLLPEADAWLEHCREAASRHAIGFQFRRLRPAQETRRFDGLGLEGWARRERYRALADIARDCGARAVLTAHHLQDQIETVRMLASRGAGARGLAGMRESRSIATLAPDIVLLRPFLEVEPARLRAAVIASGASWVEDPSNDDPHRARTSVRRLLAREIEGAPATLARLRMALELDRRAWEVERKAAVGDYERCVEAQWCDVEICDVSSNRNPPDLLADEGAAALCLRSVPLLSRDRLGSLPRERQDAVLRHWLDLAGLAMPGRAWLQELRHQLLDADSSQAVQRLAGRWIVRYRSRIGILSAWPTPIDTQPAAASATAIDHDPGGRWITPPAGIEVKIDVRIGIAHAAPDMRAEIRVLDQVGPAIGFLPDALMLDRCRSGDRMRLDPDAPSRSWKNLCQEAGIPAWLRPCLPALRDARSGRLLWAAPFGMSLMCGLPEASRPGLEPPPLKVDWQCPREWVEWLPRGTPCTPRQGEIASTARI